MRKAVKSPSEWLRLLCKEWFAVHESIALATDSRFLEYKPYMRGVLSSQLLCRLSIPPARDLLNTHTSSSHSYDFWEILGVHDPFDRAYIVAQVRKNKVLI
jgi:hypothetical protein